MKETQQHLADNVRQEVPAQHQNKQKLLSKKPIKKGHTLFEFDFKANTIRKCPFENSDVIHFKEVVSGTKPKRNKVVIQPNCLYIPALNFKNAIRHIHNKIQDGLNPKII